MTDVIALIILIVFCLVLLPVDIFYLYISIDARRSYKKMAEEGIENE